MSDQKKDGKLVFNAQPQQSICIDSKDGPNTSNNPYNSLQVLPDVLIPFTNTPKDQNKTKHPIYLDPKTNAVSTVPTKSYVWDGLCWNCDGRLKFEGLTCAGICSQGEGGPNSSDDLDNCLRVSQDDYVKIINARLKEIKKACLEKIRRLAIN